MPGKNDSNGWKHVIRNPNRNAKRLRNNHDQMIYKFETDEGDIFVEYLNNKKKVELTFSIKNSVDYFLTNHNETRNIEGESGTMAMAGDRLDLPLSAKVQYVPSSKQNDNNSRCELNMAIQQFNRLMLQTVCAKSFRKEIEELTKIGKLLLV